MIYLIDDNRHGQMSKNYKVDYTFALSTYSDYITWLTNFADKTPASIIMDASCILIHDSVLEKEQKEELIALAKKNKRPFCIFSNGFTATRKDGGNIIEIKKDRLYFNLIAFLDNNFDKNEINFDLLCFGENYEYEKVTIIQDRLVSKLFENRRNFNYETVFVGKSNEWKDLQELVHIYNVDVDFDDYDEKNSSAAMTAESMVDEIKKMVNAVLSRYE